MPRPFEKVTENRADNIYHGPKIRIEMLAESFKGGAFYLTHCNFYNELIKLI